MTSMGCVVVPEFPVPSGKFGTPFRAIAYARSEALGAKKGERPRDPSGKRRRTRRTLSAGRRLLKPPFGYPHISSASLSALSMPIAKTTTRLKALHEVCKSHVMIVQKLEA